MSFDRLDLLIAVLAAELRLTPVGYPGRSVLVRTLAELRRRRAALRAARQPTLF
jgi:hypothetical protein